MDIIFTLKLPSCGLWVHLSCMEVCKRDDWYKLCLKARERGTAISMEGLGNELGTRDSQVKLSNFDKIFD